VGDYELWARVGTGGTGAVWKAYRPGSPARIVAVKRLRAPRASGRAGMRRLQVEADVLAELDHPHVVRLVDVVDDGDGVAVVMELAPGGSLEALLAERRQLPPGEVVAIAAPIADALAAAHRVGIVHGDVKAANILFGVDGRPLLADFDVAHSARSPAGDEIVGTAEYLAPERLLGEAPDPRSDVYALGVVCYEALAGYVPFAAATVGHAAPLLTLGPLAESVERALAREPRDRFPSAEAFALALRASVPPSDVRLPRTTAASPSGVATAPVPGSAAWPEAWTEPTRRPTVSFGPRPPRPQARRARWRAVAAVAAVVAAVLLLALIGR
jgi:serine/threonine-protein kinase